MSRRSLFLLFSFSMVFGETPKSDGRINDLVMLRIAGDQIVGGPGRIEVSVTDAVVTLKGSVETEKQKNRAEHLAKKVKGVKSVDNQLKVVPR